MKRIVLLKAWKSEDGTEYAARTVLEADTDTVKELIAAGVAMLEKDWEAQEKKKEADKKAADKKRPNITVVKDLSGDDPTTGFKTIGEYCGVVAAACRPGGAVVDSRLAKNMERQQKLMGESIDSTGGHVVPIEYKRELLEKMHAEGRIVRLCGKQPMASNALEIPAISESSRAAGSRWGGVRAYRKPEIQTAAMTATQPTYEKVAFKLKDMYVRVDVTNDLLEDSMVALGAHINRVAPAEMNFKTEDEIINGTGGSQMLGILNAPCKIEVTAETGQGAATLVYLNIIKMYARFSAMGGAPEAEGGTGGVWLANRTVFPQLVQMSLDVGTGGSAVWLPAGGASGRPYDMLFGLPVIYVEQCQALGTAGDIILVDLSTYLLASKSSGIRFDISMHLRFDYDEMVFRFVLRNDGQPWWSTALTPYKGSDTISPFVTLSSTRT